MPGAFQTPQNQKSFSALIDQCLLDTGQQSSLLSAVAYANATLRECHSLGLFSMDLIEDNTTLITGSPFIFSRPHRFRKLRTIQFGSSKIYPKFIMPGRKQHDECHYYYAADDYFVVAGGITGEALNTAIYFFPPKFAYYPILGATNIAILPGDNYTIRPAYFDTETELWMYLNATQDGYVTTLGDPTAEAAAQKVSLNWMMEYNYEVIMEGTKAKLFQLKGDSRAPTSYSLFGQMKDQLRQSFNFESEDF